MNFDDRYDKLNTEQKEAVDIIDGPVMVIAGPGTGKTELLSIRVANILKKTDTLPENILCLTFTDSGAKAMRERLVQIISKEAYKVAIHTFHSFGSEVINQNGQYFYNGANFKPADELSSYEIIRDILRKLDHKNPLISQLNGEYTHLSDIFRTISEIKKNGLNSDELAKILDINDTAIEKAEKLITPIFNDRISKKTLVLARNIIQPIRDINEKQILSSVVPLSQVIADALENAIIEAETSGSTKPITAWKGLWLEKNNNNQFVLKTRSRQTKLRALGLTYDQYIKDMQTAELYDFDDMVLQIVHKMEENDDLRFNLQEKYQYIMVDEFQDTNMAQMRILHNLTNNPAQGDTPNILVVGDDDQAIYSFQGADVSNIIEFRNTYPKSKIITLVQNYRSTTSILETSRDVILQGENRLENVFKDISKKLTAQDNTKNSVKIYEAETTASEYYFVAQDIKSAIDAGQNQSEIAVLTRHHKEIKELLPYLYKFGISVNYERQDNILDQEIIVLIEQIGQLFIYLATNRHDDANAILPKILAHSAFGIEPMKLWQLSSDAYDGHKRWLDIMAQTPELTNLQKWIIKASAAISQTPLEQMLDLIIGKTTSDSDEFTSPIYDYFFSTNKLSDNPTGYLEHLESLRLMRDKLREYKPNQNQSLVDFIEFISLNRQMNRTINLSRQSAKLDNAINVMTAHKSKGLEFETVYIINATEKVWGAKARSRNRLINYPENLPIAPAGETSDERLRLFYVAMTRAKKSLIISYSIGENSRGSSIAGLLLSDKLVPAKIESHSEISQLTEIAEINWYQPIIEPMTPTMKDLLAPKLDNYKLSATHLNNFTDVANGGPATFLLHNLLRFPQVKTASAVFGTVIHETIQSAHNYLAVNGKKMPVAEVVRKFESSLKKQHLPKTDLDFYLKKGGDVLNIFLDQKYDTFNQTQQTELNFSSQQSLVDQAHITGKLDLVDINKKEKTITVTDYKTGKSLASWKGQTEFEKIKLHKYKQQLLFYKLLVENSRDYHGYQVEKGIMQFVEPTKDGQILNIETDFTDEDIDKSKKLISAIWSHILDLNFPDTSNYAPNYKGILDFEQDLIENKI